jgi:hypothetical protein
MKIKAIKKECSIKICYGWFCDNKHNNIGFRIEFYNEIDVNHLCSSPYMYAEDGDEYPRLRTWAHAESKNKNIIELCPKHFPELLDIILESKIECLCED